MIKINKLKVCLILLLLSIGINYVSAFDNTSKVYDYAQVFTMSEENNLKLNINEYIEKYNIDMIIVTVKHRTQKTTKLYAQEFYNYNGFGKGQNLDGIIFVMDFSLDNLETQVEVFGDAIKIYDHNRVKDLLQEITRNKEKGYFKMSDLFIRNAYKYAKEGVVISNPDNIESTISNSILKKPIPWIFILIASLVVSSVTIIILIFKNKMIRKSTNANLYLKKDSIVINVSDDDFITTATTSSRINHSSDNESK